MGKRKSDSFEERSLKKKAKDETVQMKRSKKSGKLKFPDFPDFQPNKTPKEIIQAGSFGGTYFRNIKSGVTHEKYKDMWKEFPEHWFEGLKISLQVANPIYDKDMNKYKVKCGASLDEWEGSGIIVFQATVKLQQLYAHSLKFCFFDKGWIKAQDPYGWFQWYCRFFLGRRTSDDQRQVSRWKNFNGRFKNNLINKIKKANTKYDDFTISPVIRQSLLHWGIELTEGDIK